MTTSIIIPVSVPGANEAAGSINRAADAVEKLAAKLEHERSAARGAASETRVAAQAANELAAAEARADQAMVARSRSTVATNRANAQWAQQASGGTSKQSKFINLGGAASATASTLGVSNPLIGAGFGLAQQFAPQLAAASAGTLAIIATAAATVAASGYLIYSAFQKVSKRAEETAASLAVMYKASDAINQAQKAANSAGLSVYDRTRKNATIATGLYGESGLAAAKAAAKENNFSIDDALAATAGQLDTNQMKAASLASNVLGISVGDAITQISTGKFKGTPEQIVLAMSGGKLNSKQIATRAKNIASSSYGALSAAIDKERSGTGLEEFNLIDLARSGAADEGQTVSDLSNPESAYATSSIRGLMQQMASTTDKDRQSQLQREIDTLISNLIPGQRTVNAAGR